MFVTHYHEQSSEKVPCFSSLNNLLSDIIEKKTNTNSKDKVTLFIHRPLLVICAYKTLDGLFGSPLFSHFFSGMAQHTGGYILLSLLPPFGKLLSFFEIC